MATQIRRDSFARMTLMRETVRDARLACVWCGWRPGRFRYYWEPDTVGAIRRRYLEPEFCGIECWDAYTS